MQCFLQAQLPLFIQDSTLWTISFSGVVLLPRVWSVLVSAVAASSVGTAPTSTLVVGTALPTKQLVCSPAQQLQDFSKGAD